MKNYCCFFLDFFVERAQQSIARLFPDAENFLEILKFSIGKKKEAKLIDEREFSGFDWLLKRLLRLVD